MCSGIVILSVIFTLALLIFWLKGIIFVENLSKAVFYMYTAYFSLVIFLSYISFIKFQSIFVLMKGKIVMCAVCHIWLENVRIHSVTFKRTLKVLMICMHLTFKNFSINFIKQGKFCSNEIHSNYFLITFLFVSLHLRKTNQTLSLDI